MTTASPASSGFVGALRKLGDDCLAVLQGRVELVSIELQEEKSRLMQTLVWISAAVFAGGMALVMASFMLVFVFWQDARLAVLGGLTLFYVGALVGIVIAFRRFLARQPAAFAATLNEIKKDRTCIRTGN